MSLDYASPGLAAAPVSQTRLKVQLSIFMFLQYYIWGSWYSSLGAYLDGVLNFDGAKIGAAYGAFAIGSMISPFFIGLIADRFFASEKILGALGILGGAVICVLPQMHTFGSFYPMLILYCALFAPTLALGNSLSLHHLLDAKRDFPRVKILSAVGWIAGGVTLSALHGEVRPTQFYLAGVISVIFGFFSLSLPHTPPKKVGGDVSIGEILGLDALALLRRRAFAVCVVCLFLICIPIYFYFVNMGIYLGELKWPNFAGRMTLAQVSDIVFLFLLPLMLKRFGYKWTIVIGILSWIVRYFLLAQSFHAVSAQSALIFMAILLHGVCYDFLFIAGQLYVDDQSNERMRGAAQGFIAFILWGIGAFVGATMAGIVLGRHELTADRIVGTIKHDWRGIWMTPALLAVGVLVVFLLFFREPRRAETGDLPAGEAAGVGEPLGEDAVRA
jgi:nucleoside transporter